MRTIKLLVGLMSQHDLSEIDLRDGEHRIRLRRGVEVPLVPAPAAAAAAPVVSAATAASTSAPAAAASEKPAKPVHLIKSPTPGTFYAAADPKAEPFVRVGSRVMPNTVVCLIEAMKIFNEINADCTGVVTEVLIENQQPVEFGQVLFKVDPTG
jgi:acetyl-CoA carboxylase biotin carboxyl carrier protein